MWWWRFNKNSVLTYSRTIHKLTAKLSFGFAFLLHLLWVKLYFCPSSRRVWSSMWWRIYLQNTPQTENLSSTVSILQNASWDKGFNHWTAPNFMSTAALLIPNPSPSSSIASSSDSSFKLPFGPGVQTKSKFVATVNKTAEWCQWSLCLFRVSFVSQFK